MKVTLIRPHFNHNPYEPPLGIASLAACLEEKGHAVGIIDFEADPYPAKNVIKQRIEADNPDVVGISFFTYDRFEAVRIAEAAKSLDKTVVGGGLHITFDPVNTLRSVPAFDFAVLGEGEATLLELTDALDGRRPLADIQGIAYRTGGKVQVNPRPALIRDLDALPLPAYHLLPMNRYPYHQILGSRGCPYKCPFCSSPEFWRRKIRFRSATSVVDEIEHLVDHYGRKEFDFKDDILFLDKSWTRTICEEILKRDLDIEWNCLGRANLVDETLFRLMRRAGCTFMRFGVESGAERILRTIDKKITKDQVRFAVRAAHRASIEVGTLFMLGHPSETKSEMEETYRFAVDLGAEHYSFKPVDIYPGTALFHQAVDEGLLTKDFDWFVEGRYKGGTFIYADVPSYVTAQFSRERLENTTKEFYLRAFMDRLFTLESLSDFKTTRFRTGIGFIPRTRRDLQIALHVIREELKTRRPLQKRVFGIIAAVLYFLQKVRSRLRRQLKSKPTSPMSEPGVCGTNRQGS